MTDPMIKVYDLQLMVIVHKDTTRDDLVQQFDLIFDKLAEEKGICVFASRLDEILKTGGIPDAV